MEVEMQIFEIFNCATGRTEGYRFGEKLARETADRCTGANGTVYDYLPAKDGFFVLDMRDNVKAGPFATKAEASRKADFEDMASDTNSFRVFEQGN